MERKKGASGIGEAGELCHRVSPTASTQPRDTRSTIVKALRMNKGLLTVVVLALLATCAFAVKLNKHTHHSKHHHHHHHNHHHHHHPHSHSSEKTVNSKLNSIDSNRNGDVSKSRALKDAAMHRAKAASAEEAKAVAVDKPKHHLKLTHTSLVELNSKTTEKDLLHAQAKAHAHARARAHANAMLISQATASLNALGIPSVQAYGRGRGVGRPSMYVGPDEFDNSWWQPPPPVGSDPFLQGYSQKVYPSHLFGYGGMPGGGFGTAHHYWGGPSYKYPLNQPWWRGRSYYTASRASKSPYLPYQTPRDSYGMMQPGMGSNLPVSSPYYYTPPPLQGDWNLPRNPPPPPAAAAAPATKS